MTSQATRLRTDSQPGRDPRIGQLARRRQRDARAHPRDCGGACLRDSDGSAAFSESSSRIATARPRGFRIPLDTVSPNVAYVSIIAPDKPRLPVCQGFDRPLTDPSPRQ